MPYELCSVIWTRGLRRSVIVPYMCHGVFELWRLYAVDLFQISYLLGYAPTVF